MIKAEPATLKKLAKFIFERSEICGESCNSHHIECCIQQIRGAVWMFTGNDPGSLWNNYQELFDAIEMPYEVDGDRIYALIDGERV